MYHIILLYNVAIFSPRVQYPPKELGGYCVGELCKERVKEMTD
ncbi:hypothetical protein CLOSTMETH_00755 [[Clostridium] methylpentosum DSM 5476]|uniref:Uncharacterized protein n=1 Tax=[Clostridium] methylpentosum DSM 5476 TaxID=537013 RepID=C0EAA1_9FIRM|nr:hypothetical protein CLOSTMETH_00755 [[Clostridium] methylpentosum DSM 5476]